MRGGAVAPLEVVAVMRSIWDDIVVVETMRGVGRRLAAVVPNVLTMVVLLLLGLAIGAVARALVVRVLRAVRFSACASSPRDRMCAVNPNAATS